MLNGLPTVRGIYVGGEYFEGDVVFMNDRCIALGWPLVGDLRDIPVTREAFKRHLTEKYKPFGNVSPDRMRSAGGTLYKFFVEIQIGDIMIYHSTYDEQIFIGEVTGEYEYVYDPQNTATNPDARHRRAVTWYQPKVYFSDIARKAASSGQSLWQITDKATVQEFLKALKRAKADHETITASR